MGTEHQKAADSLASLRHAGEFIDRHIGPDAGQIQAMLDTLGLESLKSLVDKTVPQAIALNRPLDLPGPLSESEALTRLKAIASKNQATRSYIGLGYYDTETPGVILRGVMQNPGWYTAYTPYQSEISQGRLECLLNFQQMVTDLTAMELANASLLDEATAAAEAMALARRVSKQRAGNRFFVDAGCFPQTIDVIRTRAECFGFELVIGQFEQVDRAGLFGAIFQYPSLTGEARDLSQYIAQLHANQAIAIVAADLMSLALLKPPGEMGADVVLGSTQRFGVPMGYGGPHAAYLATRNTYRRAVPGRIIGVSVDRRGQRAYRMALQTREQHIRREKANSNICTAQVLLANISALYAMYHGPRGIHRIASRIHRLTRILATGLQQQPGIRVVNANYFDTITLQVEAPQAAAIARRATQAGINLRMDKKAKETTRQTIGISLDECTDAGQIERLWQVILGESEPKVCPVCGHVFQGNGRDGIDAHWRAHHEHIMPYGQAWQLIQAGNYVGLFDRAIVRGGLKPVIPAALRRQSAYLSHPVFNRYHSETEMMRYLKRLENKDISLTHGMIPLGSCTMKLNAATEMLPVTWAEFSKPHPFTPVEQMQGYREMISGLEAMLQEILGFDAISMQPNSGAQGEYAGLLAIRKYLDSRGEQQRNVCLIPTSAHGTNPASARMLGMQVVLVACDQDGNIDQADLQAKAGQHADTLAALMITYPSTHGVYEEGVAQICQLVHDHGGQVYMDGANLNAQVGVARPADIGADVSHVNLHKTFCIPHGGGGPGMGPIGVKAHLAPFLANHPLVPLAGPRPGNTAVAAAPWGSCGILPIPWMYITMMGGEGLLQATRVAMLNANYIAARLAPHYPVLYTGRNGMVAHECIIDIRPLKQATGISEEDVAKRLMDFGFHAPTMSFPVAGTLMIEPTESESKYELDRFIAAMIRIRQEIAQVESGEMDAENNPLKNAPHTLADLVDEIWQRPYSKAVAAFPGEQDRQTKYWPPVNRVDNAYGDRNLFCSCPPIDSEH